MINHTSSVGPGATPGPDPRRPRPAVSGAPAPDSGVDRLNTDGSTGLRQALASTPALRPEVVARAQTLAVDPNYPPLQIIERVARLLASSQDASETQD